MDRARGVLRAEPVKWPLFLEPGCVPSVVPVESEEFRDSREPFLWLCFVSRTAGPSRRGGDRHGDDASRREPAVGAAGLRGGRAGEEGGRSTAVIETTELASRQQYGREVVRTSARSE